MQLQLATREQVKIKAGLQGPAGSGKTLSSLIAAYGITGDWKKIAFIDTENRSASLYADRFFDTINYKVGRFQVLNLEPPFTPERCIEAMRACNVPQIEVVIFDSISHEWNGKGGILDLHSEMGKMNDMMKWAKLTPRHNNFVDEILRYPKHMFLCMRSKQDYVMKEGTNASGRSVVIPEKVGLKAVTKDGVDYEFTVNFEIDINNFAHITKDRTGLFKGKPEFKVTEETGKLIKDWCETGVEKNTLDETNESDNLAKLPAIQTIDELNTFWYSLQDSEKTAKVIEAVKNRSEQIKQKPVEAVTPSNNEALHLSTIEAITDTDTLSAFWKALQKHERTPAITKAVTELGNKLKQQANANANSNS
jgi:hypothetical protein